MLVGGVLRRDWGRYQSTRANRSDVILRKHMVGLLTGLRVEARMQVVEGYYERLMVTVWKAAGR